MATIAINGLGRIGRASLKIIMDNPQLELVAVNDLLPSENLAYLLKYDTVYGRYQKEVSGEGDSINIGGKSIKLFNIKNPVELPWKDLGVDIVLECTGIFSKKDQLQMHLDAGAKYAVLSAPGKGGGIKTVVPGVNSAEKEDTIFSTASCTTNCIAPVVEIMKRRIGIEKALMTTIHAYTSSQNIVDGPSKKVRRGRAGAINLVPTSTGAAKATALVIEDLEGIFDGVAIRAPVPVGSVSDIVFVTNRTTSVTEINSVFQEESTTNRYKGILGVSEEEIVSSDIIGDTRGSIVDLTMTMVVGSNLVKIMSWYDNEWGYASQMVRESARVAKMLE
ncbi:type I glyceraldehyde-3-phosphate dehydrogenase [Chitinispirillales bacterium ANBcel5]|uniref:type I glyceraldehyde-3-phosphate dehydrogenase n=1 Tax=Cellulosispirillum alkaliphilum TaxID=3039283 RepID=UPI002A505D95|nr:type I glyceraldehyde-3-phosphate dehydrogenase [Chitinispirillales bacterium ANBcel5]